MDRETQEIAFVTGAASGIGRAIAIQLAHRGVRVGMSDRDRAGLAESSTLIHRTGGTCEILVADVTEPDEIRRIAGGELYPLLEHRAVA